jgi:DNA invertase Pin-like site-specific DNA recombinase
VCLRAGYDDGGFSGATIGRPALQRLLADITAGRVDIVVVYKIDRLTRSLAAFAKIVEILDARGASFVSVTQQFNTTTSMGRLTLNVLLSFAQFEREVIGERIRDKIAASKKKAGGGEKGVMCRLVTHLVWFCSTTTMWRVHGQEILEKIRDDV